MTKLTHLPSVRVRTGISVNLKKSLEILSLNTIELTQNLQKMLLENVFLEEVRPPALSLEDVILRHRGAEKTGDNNFESFSFNEKTLQEHLLEQVSISDLNDRQKNLAQIIVTSINKKGWIKEDHETLAIKNGFSRKEASRVVDFLMQLEPLGVCARGVWQSLEWQAKVRYSEDTVLPDIIAVLQQGQKEITEIDEKTILGIISYLNVPEVKIRSALEKLKTLEVNPAGRYNRDDQNYIIPEIIYSVKGENISVSFSNPLLPEINLNTQLLEQLDQDKNKKQWREMYNEARNLVKSIDYRKNSMMKIAKIIASKQRTFFKKGEKYLKPMILKDIAEITSLNISTVSRILKNKYCVTPYGILPLSFFLMKKVKGIESGDLGVDDLKKALKLVVSLENHENPLPDISIVEKLREYGFNIQRRTVSKYRKLLHIPSAKQRKVL